MSFWNVSWSTVLIEILTSVDFCAPATKDAKACLGAGSE